MDKKAPLFCDRVPAKKRNKVEPEAVRLTQYFLKSVAAHLGLYNEKSNSFVPDLEEKGVYKSNLEIIEGALAKGWSYEELHALIGLNYREKKQAALFSEILPKRIANEEENLLDPGDSYYHPALYVRTPARLCASGDQMTVTRKPSSSLKERFTLRDLMEYYYQKMGAAPDSRRHSAQAKTMGWLLSQAHLDEVLFAIDLAGDSDRLVPVIDLNRFLMEAAAERRYYQARHE
jgi:hypothetical protein